MAGLSDADLMAKHGGGSAGAGLSDEQLMAQHGPQGEQPKGFPYDTPGRTYGEGPLSFFSIEDKTGKVSPDVPEFWRGMLRGGVEYGKGLTGRPDAPKTVTPDMVSAVMGFGGLRAAPGSGSFGPVTAQARARPIVEEAPTPTPSAVEKARGAGYVLPPAELTEKPGLVADALAGMGGKIKLQQAASMRNQEITDNLAIKALGLPEKTTLNDQTFRVVREQAGQDYAAIPRAMPVTEPDGAFKTAVAGLGGRTGLAAQHFPELMDHKEIALLSDTLGNAKAFPTQAGLDIVRNLRFKGNANLKAIGDPEKHALGLAQRQAADAIDELIERRLEASAYAGSDREAGIPHGLVDRYRKARQLIAKSYDVEGATDASGHVNAAGLARLAAKGRPFTDELATIADTANSFPKSMQNPSRFGGNENYSALDFFGSAMALAHGNPGIAAMLSMRAPARNLVLSRGFQDRMAVPPPGAPLSAYAQMFQPPPQ